MALQSSGAISLNQIHIEAGGSSGTQCSINDSDIRALIGKSSGATMSFSEWYGASASITETLSNGDTNVNVSTEFGSSNFTSNTAKILIIASGSEIGATGGTGNRAITVPSGMGGTLDIQNAGTISGAGGAGGTSSGQSGSPGGSAIYIASSNVTVTNSGTIRGGGGGGGAGNNGSPGANGFQDPNSTLFCNGGSGGGHGDGGNGQGYNSPATNGVSGSPGGGATAVGNYGSQNGPICAVFGPGSPGGSGGNGGNGGSFGNAGGNGQGLSNGGSAGKYVEVSGVSYTLSNSGTVQGST